MGSGLDVATSPYRRAIGIALLVAAALSASCASGPYRSMRLDTDGADAALALDAGIVLPTSDCAGYFIVPVYLDGHGPFPMVLDTGAGSTVITREAARESGVHSRAREMRIGALTLRGAEVHVQEFDHISRALGTRIEGIVGHPLFRELLVTYDYPARQVRVRRGQLEPDDPGVVRTALRYGRPHVVGEIGDLRLWMLIDTGAVRGVQLRDVERFEFESGPRETDIGARFEGHYIVRRGRLAEDLVLGPVTVETPIVSSSKTTLIGQGVLSNFVLTFDTRNGLMRFERPDAPLSEPITSGPVYTFGIGTVPTAEGWIVRRIFDGSPAADAGLEIDDVIVALDGRGFQDVGCDRLTRRDDGPAAHTLEVLRDGERISIDVESVLWVP